jgi:hypothetical protein
MFPLQSLISIAGAYTNCKRQLVMPAQKIQKEVRPSQERAFFFTVNFNFVITAKMRKLRLTVMQFMGIL